MVRQRQPKGGEQQKEKKHLQRRNNGGSNGRLQGKNFKMLRNMLVLVVVFIMIGSIFISKGTLQVHPDTLNQDLCTTTDQGDCTNGRMIYEVTPEMNNESAIIMGGVEKEVEKVEEGTSTCSVYLAPSSVLGGGMGMFTTKEVKKGAKILPADGPSIPIIDPDQSQRSLDAWVNLFASYWWESGISDPALYESQHTAEYQITMGALPNSHPYLNNMDVGHPAIVPYDDSFMDRMADPGAGASSYYMGRHTIAYMDMDAGEEVFLEYPDDYMNAISEKYNIPKRSDYEDVGMIVLKLYRKYGNNFSAWKNDEIFTLSPAKLQSLLPKTQKDVERVLAVATNPSDAEDLSLAIAKEISVNRRSPKWIEEHGVCLDNILPGMSTNTQAGKGAIAQRFMKKGSTVAPASLLQITNRDALRIPAFEGDQWQLLLNYCLGHPSSSLLLCPNTNAVLLNHCSSRRPDIHPCGKGGGEPNARYRWAEWDVATDVWLNKTIAQMEEEGGRGLSLELVATRDIEQGEEVFIDYGISWEKAWDEHVQKWEPPVYHIGKEEKWTSAAKLNEELLPLKLAPNLSADHVSLDSRNVLFTGCYYYEDDEGFFESFDEDEGSSWEGQPMDEVITNYGRTYGHKYPVHENRVYSDGSFWPCVVFRNEISPGTGEESYTVRIIQSHVHETTIWEQKSLPRIISNYSRRSIRHFYLPYQSDLHSPLAFRHHIELPEELLPVIWRDR
eukprot:CAMPEP_0203668890 /NCGR_PEP_ID=MMETSP0090-20130426/5404_1 /ASSEMBLY_ACC=CAM_ASM_001088 /TAXON_ID=426623 /ORGANISM="Chaetoceros affinis, Strain CCMP159" /LENGTH=726 /DNA_ID=CAMNT_0050533445 /DNA_START=123 /DNA_END=2303 /DNA_ORIENTATION=+